MSNIQQRNQNKENVLVNLPIIILGYIVNRVHDNIDRICLSLVCKRWFEERNKYLLFNTDTINLLENQNVSNRCHLKSYQYIYSKSLELKNDVTFYIGNKYFFSGKYDYYHDHLLSKEDSIQRNVSTIILDNIERMNLDFDLLKDAHIDADLLYKMISNSNVTKLYGCRTLKSKLPDQISDLSFYHRFNEQLTNESLPLNIKHIAMCRYYDKPIGLGVLPDGLESITFGYLYNLPIEKDTLPTSLKSLAINSESIKLLDSLPPNLEVLILSGGVPKPIDSNFLPITIRSLQYISVYWLPYLANLPNLTSILLFDILMPVVDCEFPPNLTDLVFASKYVISVPMPPLISHLNNFQLEVGPLPASVKHLILDNFQSIIPGSIPKSLESLELLNLYRQDKEIPIGLIPDTLRSLKLEYSEEIISSIPRTLTNIILKETEKHYECHIRKLDHHYLMFEINKREEVIGEGEASSFSLMITEL
ncbi:hypothetical protein PPL_06321 [Heterostelium album PN500]|uniref:Uncharacterized protein n=1 Tax=Heterostelium pallidum (strain ATCC 26659 / Pp 5 / PN500) TaxID=670386 RepID=D3BCU3_HETP5|nr:hypothetical protein PPL_06321 [Heterostelium album PN500]EFA80735.1 hypothetical protein PPL_06321 [Heterostelium album PN500]|eukprot:XP_020432855.1 hypothetical protein PPL_06321 [Heterostelium album PN500]